MTPTRVGSLDGGPARRRAAAARVVAFAAVATTAALGACDGDGEASARPSRAEAVAPSGLADGSAAGSAAGTVAPSVAGADSADSARLAAARADSLRRARADSIRASRDPRVVHASALAASGLRILVSLDDRRLMVLDGPDTVRVAPVGIGMDSTLVYEGRVWNFRTPRGTRRVLGKQAEPIWTPPEWHYVEVARARGLALARIPARGALAIDDSTRIVVQDGEIGLSTPQASFTPFAADEEVIWEGTLYIPPVGTRQRQVAGALGRFRLDLGDGYLLHGTPHAESVGQPSSHGCMRLGDDDIAWLYENVPVGTPVYTY